MNRLLTAIVRLFALLVVLGATAVLPASAASAVTSAQPAEGEGGQLLVILDVSGSMERTDPSGTTLMDGARQAVRDFVGGVPEQVEVGLRLYGSEYAGDVEAQGCRDTELAVPIAPASESGSDIVAAVDQAQPTGFTPIGYSLTQAAADFTVDDFRAIVLVSDGEDTCGNPAPCQAAKQLARGGIEVRIDTVGLFLQDNAAARKQLECIAKATGGTYVPADDTAALTEQLSAVSSRAISTFQAAGEEVVGGPAQTQATPIEAGTAYVDDILKGEARWYSFDLVEGQQVTITATDDGSVDYGCCLSYSFLGPGGNQLARDSGYNERGTANTYVIGTTTDDGVFDAGTYYFSVTLDDSTNEEEYGALPFQFTVETTDPVATETPTETPTPTASATDTPTATPTDEPTASDSASSDSSSVPSVVWVLIGVLVLAVVALGAMVLVLLRRVGANPR